jgi:hypothetical protein
MAPGRIPENNEGMVLHPSAYESYEGFLKAVVARFWEAERDSRVDALALLLASREAWEVALDKATAQASLKNLLAGAAGATAITFLLRGVLGGPLGLILTGASVASLGTLYAKNQERIRERARAYRRLVTQYRSDFETIREDYLAGRVRRQQRDLMVEGLFARLLAQLGEDAGAAIEPADGEPGVDERDVN